MRVVFLSHTAMGGPFVVGSHHLAKAFRRAGHAVTHLSAAVSFPHLALAVNDRFVRARVRRWLRGGEDIDGVRDLVPFTPLPWNLARLSATLMRGYSDFMRPAPMRGAGSLELSSADWLVIDEPRFVGVAARHGAAKIIYRATDLYSLMRADPKIACAERILCDRASALVATSAPVAKHLEQISGRSARVISNGVDVEHFASPRRHLTAPVTDLPGTRAERAVYVGAFDSRFGREAFGAAVRGWPDKHFVLAGPGSERIAADFPHSNVLALGAVPYALLPSLLHQCAVGLLPLSGEASNMGRSPMKLYEYVVAGLSVAATRTPELRRRDVPTLVLADGAAEFCAAVGRAFQRARDAALLDQARLLASSESWDRKAQELRSVMDGVVAAQPLIANVTIPIQPAALRGVSPRE
jgi:teichuronic acid biosynthesis glycosyltransferase TuaH